MISILKFPFSTLTLEVFFISICQSKNYLYFNCILPFFPPEYDSSDKSTVNKSSPYSAYIIKISFHGKGKQCLFEVHCVPTVGRHAMLTRRSKINSHATTPQTLHMGYSIARKTKLVPSRMSWLIFIISQFVYLLSKLLALCFM